MKIVACYNIYNEIIHILDSLNSVVPLVDEIVIVDGAFEGFPNGTGTSTDGTVEVIYDFMESLIGKSPKIKLFTNDHPWQGMSKVDRYLKEVDDGDWILRMNGDEILEVSVSKSTYEYDSTKDTNLKKTSSCIATAKPDSITRQIIEDYVSGLSDLPMFQFMEYRPPLANHYDWIPKLIKKTPDLKLTNQHLALTNKQWSYTLEGGRNRVQPDAANVPADIIRVRHMTEHRSPERIQQNHQWCKHFNEKLRYA